MLKKITLRKIYLSASALFALLLIYLIPAENPKLKVKEQLKYVDLNVDRTPIFLMDQNSYIALTEAPVSENNIEKRARELIKILTVGGMDSKIPSGFSAIIPPDTEILSLSYENGVLKVDFSKELLDVEKSLEEKMIEAIVYTLTSIDKVDKIIIYVEGDILTKLPKTKIHLPTTLDRTFGINKEFNLTSTKDITEVTIYYINQINESYYYVPVTKYLNDTRNKIDIIIDELSINFNPNKKLMSFMDRQIQQVSSNIEDKTIKIEFKKNDNNKNEEMSNALNQTISLSLCDNYDVEEIYLNNVKKMCKNAEIK